MRQNQISHVQSNALILMFSCIGRRLSLKERVIDEIEAVKNIFEHTCLSGFYTYGEIIPDKHKGQPSMQNQALAITTIEEC